RSETNVPIANEPTHEPTKVLTELHAADTAPTLVTDHQPSKLTEVAKTPAPSPPSTANNPDLVNDPKVAAQSQPKPASTQPVAPTARPSAPIASDTYSLRNASD